MVDLLGMSEDEPDVRTARVEMIASPLIQSLIEEAAAWPGYPIPRHNDARHPIYKISTLADFGLRAVDPGMGDIVSRICDHQSQDGAYLSLVNIPTAFGGSGEDQWTWLACDAPTLLYALLVFGLADAEGTQRAVDQLVGLAGENGWSCAAAPELGRFRGPGRRTDPCPIANVYALKALSQVPLSSQLPAVYSGAEMLLRHWQDRGRQKYFLFGIGSDFCKLKYPFIWYDILHVVEVLSRFPFVHSDARFQSMAEAVFAQANDDGRYTAGSMYQAWKGWSFANKKAPSPWLTLLTLRIQTRITGLGNQGA